MTNIFRILAFTFALALSGCIYSDSNRTDFVLTLEPSELPIFFEGYEELLVVSGFDIRARYAEQGNTIASGIFEGNLMRCLGDVVGTEVKLKCIEVWQPIIPFFWVRVSDQHDQLVQEILEYAKAYNLLKVERHFYDTSSEVLFQLDNSEN